eukprot:TRINITY_DN410_c0_g1_i1.p1 TRINITY_DN410_c0_g1~~TRINITY_DN410_c0_g1_i1.p1  ORF type:complete len:428 (-),score=99.19 TRINITY_DN410_c0_g1_i1:49-1305(-)
MRFLVATLLAACASATLLPNRVRYDGQSVLRVVADTPAKKFLVDDVLMLDVWSELPGAVFDVRVTPEQRAVLEKNDVAYEVYIEDLQALLDQEAAAVSVSSNPSRQSYEWFEEYHDFDEQQAFYRENCAAHADLCTFTQIGTSFEGRPITSVRLRGAATGARKLFWDGGIHAREWISSATVAYLFYTLVNGYGSNANSTFILDNYEVVIVTHQNPDGYEWSWTNDRLWRKSRKVNSGSTCRGVDLNRNYPVFWGQGGSSTNPCSDTYMGPSAGSEIETQTLINYFNTIRAQATELPVAISFHSYSQLILRPYGHTAQNSPDEVAMRNLGALMADAIESVHGLTYDNIKSIELYVTTGTTGDWYYNVTAGASFGYTYELRDTGRYGFVLPENQIIPQGEEIWAAMVVMAEDVLLKSKVK